MSSVTYSVTPANQHCDAATTVKVVSSPGTSTNNTNNDIDGVISQISKDAQFDTSSKTVTAQYGGGEEEKDTRKFIVICKKKKIIINALDEIDALQIFVTKKDFKKDTIVHVNNTTYILRVKEKSKTPSNTQSKVKSKIQFIKI